MEKNFMIRCVKCKWVKHTDGTKEDLEGLYEYPGCASCSGRKFRCKTCGGVCKMQNKNSGGSVNIKAKKVDEFFMK